MTRRRWITAALALGAVLATGCDKLGPSRSPFFGVDVTGAKMGGDLRLKDPTGKDRSLADFRGKVVALFFGYTHCPDVCPTTLADMAKAMKLLGPDAKGVQVLFVTVDPKRDTPEIMHAYVNAFDKRAVGLVGSDADVEALAKRYRSAFTREPDRGNGAYDVSHSSAIYFFDAEGKARLLATPSASQDDMVHDLHLLTSLGDQP